MISETARRNGRFVESGGEARERGAVAQFQHGQVRVRRLLDRRDQIGHRATGRGDDRNGVDLLVRQGFSDA